MDRYEREKRGIYDVTFNDKQSTPILRDIEAVEDAAIEFIAMYIKGFHDDRKDKGKGAEHIKLHLEEGSQGEITIGELVNIGHSLRAYLKQFEEPFMENETAKIYEWENKDGVRFRVVTDIQRGGPQLPLPPSEHHIITFYSDRNLNKPMKFKNPKVEEYYQQQKALQNLSPSNKNIDKTFYDKKKFSKNPKPTQETRDRYTQKVKELSNKTKIDKSCPSKSNDKER